MAAPRRLGLLCGVLLGTVVVWAGEHETTGGGANVGPVRDQRIELRHCYDNEYISRVQIGTIDNPSGCNENHYEDFSYLSTDLAYGVGETLTVTNGNPLYLFDCCAVWVDWNLDGWWQNPAERIGVVPGVGPYVFDVVAPFDAPPGARLMRIRLDYANPDPQPCGIPLYGELEDYTVNILAVLGACCWPDGACTAELPAACGGVFQGVGTTCDPSPCICPGDVNCDGVVDFGDINPFVLILSNFQVWQQTYPSCPWHNGDIDGNGSVGFQDINPFVALIVQSPFPCQY
jgi:hypothetical protein